MRWTSCKVVSTPTQTPTITPTKQPAPADTDGDGCSDEAENGPDVALGGQRDYLYFWDFYDVWTHPADDPLGWERNGLINIFDIIQVAAQFGIPLGYLGDVGDKAALVERALTPPSDLPPQGGGGVASDSVPAASFFDPGMQRLTRAAMLPATRPKIATPFSSPCIRSIPKRSPASLDVPRCSAVW